MIEFNFNDYFDRVLIYLLWDQITWTSALGPVLAPILQLFSSIVLIGYVSLQPTFVFLIMGGKSYFSFAEWLLDIALRWQFLNIFGLAILYIIELGSVAGAAAYAIVVSNILTITDIQGLLAVSYVDWAIITSILAVGHILAMVWSFYVN